MDIAIDRHIEYNDLESFFREQLPDFDFFLLYEGLNDWDDVQDGQAIFQYIVNPEMKDGFRYGISVYVKSDDELALIENLSAQLSSIFHCRTVCDASRIVLKERNHYYSLLFEQGKVFLVDDNLYEKTGQVAKVVELNYQLPQVRLG